MKMFSRILSVLLVASLGLMYTGCKKSEEDGDAAEKVQLAKLEKKSWTVTNVTLGTDDRTADFSGFTITFSDAFNTSNPKGPYTYALTGSHPSPSPWPLTGGKFRFGADATRELVRDDDGLPMTYTLSDTQLVISFTYSGTGFGRTEQVGGNWKFTFN
jgi:hypothetical protein